MKGIQTRANFVFILLVLIVIMSTGCNISGQSDVKEKVKVGVLLPLSGFAAVAGEPARDGFFMALEEANELPFEYVIEDYQSDVKKAVTAATKLIEVDDVDVIIGPVWNEFAEVVSPISVEKKVLFVSPWLGGEPAWMDSPYLFSATASERDQINATLNHMLKDNKTNIVLVYSNNAWAFSYVEILKDELLKANISSVRSFIVLDNALDFNTEILKIKSLNPEAIYSVMGTHKSQGLFNKQLKEGGIDIKKVNLYTPFSIAESGALLDNFYEVSKGIIYAAPKEMAAFDLKYVKRFGKSPGAISAATTYDVTKIIMDAVIDGSRTSDELKEYLVNLRNYEGYSNMITFNKQGRLTTEGVEIRLIS